MAVIEKQVTEQLPEFPEICELMRTAFPLSEQWPMDVLMNLTAQEPVNFRAFYDGDQFCGILYTIENENLIFVFYLAVNDKIRSKGYGTQILEWLKNSSPKQIVLNVEIPDPSAANSDQREKRLMFYRKNGITDTGYEVVPARAGREPMMVLSSDVWSFNAQEYDRLLNSSNKKIVTIRTAEK